jgi:hypothetical protein
MVKSPKDRYAEKPLKHRASNIDDGQSGRVIAQGITKSTATIQGCMICDSDMEQLPAM